MTCHSNLPQFPGVAARGKYNRTQLDDAQDAWLRKYYPITENQVLADAMGVSLETVRRLVKAMGIQGKSKRGRALIEARRKIRAMQTMEEHGVYDRKRGHPVSVETKAGLARYWQDVKAGKRDSPVDILRNTDAERYALSMEKRAKSRTELLRRERQRKLYGLPQKTAIHKAVTLNTYTLSQRHHRCSALKRGYLLDVDCSEGSPGRYIIYYDDETERSEKFEANCIADGFTFKRDE